MTPLRILHLEDNPLDAELIAASLAEGGLDCEVRVVASQADFEAAVRAQCYDLVLADYSLPGFTGLDALRLAREVCPETPFVFVSGALGEDVAIDSLKRGATDYVLKQGLERLAPSVRRALRETEEHAQLRRAQEERARLFEAERQARSEAEAAALRVRRLQSITDSALLHVSLEDLLQGMLGRIREVLEADAASVLLLSDDGQYLSVRASDGLEEEQRQGIRIPLGRGIAGRIAAERRSVIIEDLAQVEVLSPVLRAKMRSLIGAPLLIDRRVIGVAYAGTAQSHHFSDDDLSLLQLVADRIALAVDRARLYEAERSARALAEQAQRRSAFMAQASSILAQSLDYETTLSSVAQLAVGRIADWAAVELVSPGGEIRPLAVAHIDPARLELARELAHRYPHNPEALRGVPHVVRSGRSELHPEVSDLLLVTMARDAEHLRLLRQLGLKSAMIVPMAARGRMIGAITFISAEAGRRFGADDLALAEELARRAAMAVDNARLYREVHAANTAKDQFLAVLSHELRTPLTPVLAAVSVLETDPAAPAGVRSSLEMIRRNVELEARLIDDLLDLTRIAKGKLPLNLSTVDAHAVLHSAMEICRADMDAKELHVAALLTAPAHHVSADPARLQQVFWNLVKNAVKFTPHGGCIGIRSMNDGDGQVQVEVIDSGIGIEPAMLPRIFRAFEQGGDTITHRFGGLGLGLAITRALVEAMGGRITAASGGKNNGATFVVRLPTTVAPPAPAPAAPGARSGRAVQLGERKSRILLVEDHEDTARILARLLRTLGYQVTTAQTVESAVRTAGEGEFDLLVSDIGLPDGSGLEIMRQLRQRGSDLKGIALSGYGMEHDIQKSREAGFSEHITKPVDFRKLENAIQQAIAEPVPQAR